MTTELVSQNQDVPLLEFYDVDQDGMIDIVFYHDGAIHVVYNQLKAKDFKTGTIDN